MSIGSTGAQRTHSRDARSCGQITQMNMLVPQITVGTALF